MYFEYNDNRLFWKNADLTEINNQAVSLLDKEYDYRGPYFLYHLDILHERTSSLSELLHKSHLYYSVKSLSNLSILGEIKKKKNFGIDVVSGGEILRGLQAGFEPQRIVYAGVGKTQDEITLGLKNNIKSFHVESLSEIRHIAAVASNLDIKAPITLRLNPDIGVDTHEYIKTGKEETKFGVSERELAQSLQIIAESPYLNLAGLQVHLGSQIMQLEPYLDALDFLTEKAQSVESYLNHSLEYLSLGGGFGIDYEHVFTNQKCKEFPLQELARTVNERVNEKNLPWRIDFEPGRYLSGFCGVLITRIQYIKPKQGYDIAITDAGMSELIRPALYKATHPIAPLVGGGEMKTYDVVGPICESGDFFAKQYPLPAVAEKDYLAVTHAGAYASVMSSNYNTRPLIPEILIGEDGIKIIRRPQKPHEIFGLETEL